MRRPSPYWYLLPALLLLVPLGPIASGEGITEAAGPATATVRLGPLGASIKTKGTLAPLRHEGVAAEPEAYGGPFEIVETAKEGSVVKGQVLVRFDEKEYEKQLAERERGLVLARNRLQRSEHDFDLKKRESALSMKDTLRRKRLADEALARFLEFERKTKEEEYRLGFQGSSDRIKDQQEELVQLEKMYNEDDLTEETEEIVLNRTRRNLERSLKYHAFRKNRHDYTMKVALPREHEKLRMAANKAALGLERLQATQPLDLAKSEMDMDKARRDFAKKEADLEKFRQDRDVLTLKAPMAGHAVAGSLAAGKWKGLGSRETTLAPGKKVKARQVLFTVVDDAVLRVHTSVKEADLLEVKAGGPATVTCALTGKTKFEAKVEDVARYGSGGSYAVVLRLLSKDKRLRTGVACEVTMPKSSSEDVLSIPSASIRTHEKKHYAFVVGEDGEVEKTEIEVGRKADGRVEVKQGLKAGQQVLEKAPAEEKAKDKDAGKKDAGKKDGASEKAK